MSVKCPGSSIRGPESDLIQENALLSAFLFVASNRGRQLSKWKRAKSKQSFLRCRVRLNCSFTGSKSYHYQARIPVLLSLVIYNVFAFVIRSRSTFGLKLNESKSALSVCLIAVFSSYSFISWLLILLIIAGIESNPGPGSVIHIKSQNCRGLSECKKAISLLRKLFPSNTNRVKEPLIACLQETHVLNEFALDNYFQGAAIVDNGERNQRGVCILISDSFELCESETSGIGRWAIAVIKTKANDPIVESW